MLLIMALMNAHSANAGTYISNVKTDKAMYSPGTSVTGGIWKITRTGGLSDYDEGTCNGAVSSFQLYFDGNEVSANSQDNIYNNKLSVLVTAADLTFFLRSNLCSVR